jgi:hypothetical protein
MGQQNKMGAACSTYGERGCDYRVLMGKPEGKRPPGRPRRRWEDNINFRKWDVEAGSGSIWLRTGTGGGHL